MSVNLNISDFKLERYLAGDLPANEMKELKLREESDEIFKARVNSLRESGKCILEKMPFEALEQRIGEKTDEPLESPHGNQIHFSGLLLKFAAAIVLALGTFAAIFVTKGERELVHANSSRGSDMAMIMESAGDSQTRIKGMESRLEVWKKNGETAIQMENLGEAANGDELQLRYSVPEKCYGILFSMDGNGVITVHVGNGAGSVSLTPGKMVSLPFAYKLDDAPHFEKFFLMTSKNTFAIDEKEIDVSLKQAGISVTEFTVRKISK